MKGILFAIASLAAAAVSFALDNTIVNDFWNTTGYVNGAVAEHSSTLAQALDSRVHDIAASNEPAFSTGPRATVVVVR